jgi:hypothetical protein
MLSNGNSFTFGGSAASIASGEGSERSGGSNDWMFPGGIESAIQRHGNPI